MPAEPAAPLLDVAPAPAAKAAPPPPTPPAAIPPAPAADPSCGALDCFDPHAPTASRIGKEPHQARTPIDPPRCEISSQPRLAGLIRRSGDGARRPASLLRANKSALGPAPGHTLKCPPARASRISARSWTVR